MHLRQLQEELDRYVCKHAQYHIEPVQHLCGSPPWIEIEYYSVACFEHITKLMRYSAELPLRVGLIRDM